MTKINTRMQYSSFQNGIKLLAYTNKALALIRGNIRIFQQLVLPQGFI